MGIYTVLQLKGFNLLSYARQSGQPIYAVAHPPFNIPGEDYPVGPWAIPTLNPVTYGWSAATGGQCSYNTVNFWVRCDLVSSTLVGSVSGGVLNYISGAIPTVGQFIYSGVYGSTYPPYQITASLGAGQYQLAGTPDLGAGNYVGGVFVPQTTAPNVASQNFTVSTKVSISGFNFNDTRMYIDGTGYADIHNNTFTQGVNTCANGSGQSIINFNNALNTPVRLYSNFFTIGSGCSNSANLYPNAGGGVTQATFGGTISGGTTLTVTSGMNPTVGQYIAGPGFTTSQVGANPSAGVYTLSNAEPNGAYATLTTGPILGRNGVDMTAPKGSGMIDAEYNYSDKVGYLMADNMGGAIMMKHNFIDIVGGPTGHTSPFLQEAQFTTPVPYGTSFIASVAGNTLTIASGTSPQVGWLVSTKNNSADGSFTTAVVTAVSGYTVTLSLPEVTQPNVTFYSGPLYTIPYVIQSENVIINGGYSSAGQVYGYVGYLPGSGNLFNQGSGTSEDSFFVTSGYANVAPNSNANGASYYVQYLYNESSNNVIVSNSSSNNYTGTRVVNTSAIVRFLAQGSGWGTGNVGAFPGSVNTAVISNNYIDPKGASACFTVDPGVYTGPANGIPLVPQLSGNIDLIDGSLITAAACYGVNNP